MSRGRHQDEIGVIEAGALPSCAEIKLVLYTVLRGQTSLHRKGLLLGQRVEEAWWVHEKWDDTKEVRRNSLPHSPLFLSLLESKGSLWGTECRNSDFVGK